MSLPSDWTVDLRDEALPHSPSSGWERLKEFSDSLRRYKHDYMLGDGCHSPEQGVEWRDGLSVFLKDLIRSCGSFNAEYDDTSFVHFNFKPFCTVVAHSCCEWSSPSSFQCGLTLEIISLLKNVQLAYPVSSPAIIQVFLRRLAAVRSSPDAKPLTAALVDALHQTLEACPSMPSSVLKALVTDRMEGLLQERVVTHFGAVPILVEGLLSLATRSPRFLCPILVPVLVCFIGDSWCGRDKGNGTKASEDKDIQYKPCSQAISTAIACPGTGLPPENIEKEQDLGYCRVQGVKDAVLEGVMRWALDVHFRACSKSLQDCLYRAVFVGIQEAYAATKVTFAGVADRGSGRVSGSGAGGKRASLPRGCRLLLAFLGGVTGDDGKEVASFLRKLCSKELRALLGCLEGNPAVPMADPLQQPEEETRSSGPGLALELVECDLPMLECYVGHLCQCKHLSESVANEHLLWLAQETLPVLKLVDQEDQNQQLSKARQVVLVSLSCVLALILTRQCRHAGRSGVEASFVREDIGNLLEIIFDSDARPLASLPSTLARAAFSVLQRSGFMSLSTTKVVLGGRSKGLEMCPCWQDGFAARIKRTEISEDSCGLCMGNLGFSLVSSNFPRSWRLVAGTVDSDFQWLTPLENDRLVTYKHDWNV
ncbi:unnamed protein product, partial [Choristocarpus tenellus]